MADIRGPIDDLSGIYSIYQDGNLNRIQNNVRPPDIAIFATAERGITYLPQPFNEGNIATVNKIFGVAGDVGKQTQEAISKGKESLLITRVGARECFLRNLGHTSASAGTPPHDDGLQIYAVYGGTDIGTRFGIAFDTSDGRLIIQDKALSEVVFDNNPSAPVDKRLFNVWGSFTTSANCTAIGTISPLATIALNGATAVDAEMTFYPGDNGTSLSRMQLFEACFNGFAALEGYRYSYIALPKEATLDCPVATNLAALADQGTAYPTKGSTSANAPDKLGRVFIEYVDGKHEFYWDVDGDGAAEYYSVNDTGTSYGATSKGGVVFASTSFKEPNFAYALAYHCDRVTYESHTLEGCCGVEPPAIGRPLDQWVGTSPTFSTSVDNVVTVTANGSGLLGHKYMAGTTAFRNALAYGGFIRTSNPWFDDGTEAKDENDKPVDMGKFLSIWITPEVFRPRSGVNSNNAYVAISPLAYIAFRSQLPLSASPTNQNYPANSGVVTGSLNRSLRSQLKAMRYTLAVENNNEVTILDSATAARPDSDYTRQGTIRIVQAFDDVIRNLGRPHLKKSSLSAEEEVAFQKELEEALANAVSVKLFRGGNIQLLITPQDFVLGQARINTTLYAPFELNKITHSISLVRGQ